MRVKQQQRVAACMGPTTSWCWGQAWGQGHIGSGAGMRGAASVQHAAHSCVRGRLLAAAFAHSNSTEPPSAPTAGLHTPKHSYLLQGGGAAEG